VKNQTCCFTGHQEIDSSIVLQLHGRLADEIIYLICCQGVRYFVAGGALGFDTLAASTILALKPEFPEIQLILALPCKDQTRGWSDANIKKYNLIFSQADKIVYTSENRCRGCMQKRNRYLVDCSQFCVCYLTKTSGGTAYTTNYAEKQGLIVINLAGNMLS